jgi:Carboxypeptidase regulatory-like domain
MLRRRAGSLVGATVLGLAVLLATAQVAIGQPAAGSLSGTITDQTGAPLAQIPIRAVGESTGTDARTFSAESGRYELRNLPAGVYVVTIAPPCCALEPYANRDVKLAVGEARTLDITLEEGGSLNALGDDPGTLGAELRRRQVIPDRPVPRTADGHPDVSGVWIVNPDDPFPEVAEPLPWAAAIAEERNANNGRDHPHTHCLPANLPFGGGGTPFMGKYVQTPELLVILFEDVPGFRQVFLDGRAHPVKPNPTWMGHSIGRWEGDTLVVDTVGFNDRGWTDVFPRTEMLRVVERYTRTSYGRMDVEITFYDAGVFSKPLTRRRVYNLGPQEELMEYVCENNKWARDAGE